MLRIAPTAAVRAKLTAQRPSLSTTGARQVTRVLAARRSLRRAQAPTVTSIAPPAPEWAAEWPTESPSA